MDGNAPVSPQPESRPANQQARRSAHLSQRARVRMGFGAVAFAVTFGIGAAWLGTTSMATDAEPVASRGVATDTADEWAAAVEPWLEAFFGDDFGSFEDWGYTELPGTNTPGTPPQTGIQQEATPASAAESTGVVIINTELGYGSGEAAGTGMILTSNGLVVTNHHVIDSSTQIAVTDPSTGTTYSARLVGADDAHDVALLQLENASGLTPIAIDRDDAERVGDAITAVGNASGGGVLLAADGTITGLDASVTTGANGLGGSETLNGTIEISADVVSGDSGGALLDADGEVIGMNTAASHGAPTITAYAIAIEDVIDIVKQIRAGDDSGTVTIGYPAFLGIGLADSASSWTGATVGYVYDGTPAARAGLQPGDVITKVAGEAVTNDTVADALSAYAPGDKVKITWTDASGDTHSKTVTLVEGPA